MATNSKDSTIPHARFCANRNVKTAAIFVAFCAMGTGLSWRSSQQLVASNPVSTFGFVAAIAILAQVWFASKCIRERIVTGIVMIVLGIGYLNGVAALRMWPGIRALQVSRPMLWTIAALISITMLVSSLRTRRNPDQNHAA